MVERGWCQQQSSPFTRLHTGGLKTLETASPFNIFVRLKALRGIKISPAQDMPAKENVLLLSETETKLIRKDVDNLVQNIKDNLKLNYEAVSFEKMGGGGGGGGKPSLPTLDYPPMSDLQKSAASRKAKSAFLSARSSRASPYAVPSAGGGAGNKCDCDDGSRRGAGGVWAARKRYPSMSANGKGKHAADLDHLEDPLTMLHELIRYYFCLVLV